MNLVGGWVAGIIVAVAIGLAAHLSPEITGLFGAGLSLFGLVVGRGVDRLARP
jgi:hypothetical protein